MTETRSSKQSLVAPAHVAQEMREVERLCERLGYYRHALLAAAAHLDRDRHSEAPSNELLKQAIEELEFCIDYAKDLSNDAHLSQGDIPWMQAAAACIRSAIETTGASKDLLKAAISADLQHIRWLETALRNVVHAARTSGGVAGRDEYLCQYCTEAEYLLDQGKPMSAEETSGRCIECKAWLPAGWSFQRCQGCLERPVNGSAPISKSTGE